MAGPPHFTILEQDAACVVGLWHSVFVTLWRGPATVEQLQRIGKHHHQVDRCFPNGFCAFAAMSMPALAMAPEVRAEATRLATHPGNNLKAIAQVILGSGFGAAATRAMASGLTLLRKSKQPTRFFNDMSSGAEWLMPHVMLTRPELKATPAELTATVEWAWKSK